MKTNAIFLALSLLTAAASFAQTSRPFVDRATARETGSVLKYWVGNRLDSTLVETPTRTPASDYYDPADAFRLALLREVKYPEAAMNRGREGAVVIEVQFMTDGRVRLNRLLHSTGRVFDEAVLQALTTIAPTGDGNLSDAAVSRTMDFRVSFRQ